MSKVKYIKKNFDNILIVSTLAKIAYENINVLSENESLILHALKRANPSIERYDLDEISELDDMEHNVITLDEVDEFQNEEEYVEEHAEQHVAQHVETITKVNPDIKQVNVTEEEEEEENKSLANCSVKELKEKCKNQGFTNYKGLRKNKLVELLEKKPTAENNI